MRLLTSILATLVLASGAWAGVQITCSTSGNDVTISWDALEETELVRAFALDVTVDSGTIDSYSAAHASYNIYPGSIVIDAGGTVTDYGSPIADSSYPGTLGGLTTSGVTIEMGSLYASGDPTPPKSGDLITLTVSGPCNVSITENVIRGGIVMEDPAVPANPSLTGCEVGTQPTCPCQGDLDGDTWRSPDDLGILVGILSPHSATGYWVENTSGYCGDMDGDTWLSPDDLGVLVGILSPHSATGYWVECP
jgi:hypothetical protein